MALLSSDMIREIRKVAEEYSRQEIARRERAAQSLRNRKVMCRDCRFFRDDICRNTESPWGGKVRLPQMGCRAGMGKDA